MGLCKCREATTLFCYEHRKNVCEKCLVSDHPRCVVRSYVKWLQDSEFSADCVLCNQSLENGGVVRLTCYDVLHWECLDKYAKSLPAHTAPAGYTCPQCQAPIIPPDNAGSLVAQQLRQQLIGSSWARVTSIAPIPPTRHDTSKSVSSPLQTSSLPGLLPATTNGTVASPAHANGTSGGPMASSSSTSLTLSSARRPGGGQDTALLLHDHDDDKYGQRRGLAHLLRQCLGLRSLRRTFVIALAIALVLFVVLGIGSRVLTGPPV